MDLCLSRKGLEKIDASTLLFDVNEQPRKGNNAALQERYIAIRTLDLSNNSITSFTGGQVLWCLTTLDLTGNSLETLDATSLPGGLTHLKLARNKLQNLNGLAVAVPKLQELDASFNRITSSGIGDLPKRLGTLLLQDNLIDTVGPFLALSQLNNLDLSSNQLRNVRELRRLGELRALRHLELRGNPVMEEPEAVALLLEAAPKLIRLDRMPLSQSAENQMSKVYRSRSLKRRWNGSGSVPKTRGESSSLSGTRRNAGKSRSEPDMETRLLEARVRELSRLVSAAEKTEQQLRYQRKILQEQISSCAGIIDSQATELERLEGELNELRSEELVLREPAADIEQTFEQTHASLVAYRLNQSSKRL